MPFSGIFSTAKSYRNQPTTSAENPATPFRIDCGRAGPILPKRLQPLLPRNHVGIGQYVAVGPSPLQNPHSESC
jgi:hypothetical protein